MQLKEKKESRMMAGIVILMIASLFEKIVGVLLKVPLYNLLGNVGMGYFNSAYSIFSTFYIISLTGFPVAVSIMVSGSLSFGRLKEVKKISRISMIIFFIMGLVLSSVLFFGSNIVSKLITVENNSEICVKAIAPILLIICISSSMKGYYQGRKNMYPTAISEFLDSFGKCAFGIIAAIYATNKGYSTEICAAYAIAGVTVGHLLGLAFISVYRLVSKAPTAENESPECEKTSKLIKNLFLIAIPITISSMALGLTSNIDAFTVINSLKVDRVVAIGMFGDYSTLATTLFRLPQAFIAPVSTVLTPTLNNAVNAHDELMAKKTIKTSIKIASLVSFPAALGLSVLSYPIIYLLFGNSNTTDSIKSTAPLLSILALGVIFLALVTVTSSIFQVYKRESIPVISTFAGAALKLILNLVLVPIIGIYGAPISSLLGYMLMIFINGILLKKYIYKEFSFIKTSGKVLISSLIMAGFAYGIYTLLNLLINSSRISVIISIVIAVIVYIISLIITKAITKEDLSMINKGDKIISILEKIGIKLPA